MLRQDRKHEGEFWRTPALATWCRIAFLAVMACLLLAPGSHAADSAAPLETASPKGAWPVFRGDPLATGVASGALSDQLDVLWRFISKDHGFEATVAIADGLV